MDNEKIEQCFDRIDAGMKYLMGDPLVPNDDGALYRIEKHLEKLNGTVKQHDKNLDAVNYNQCHLGGRVWSCLPFWVQVSLVVLIASALADIGFVIKYLA